MKTIKSAVIGVKTMESGSDDLMINWIREVLVEHRNVLLGRLLGDLPTYIAYKFDHKPTKSQLDGIREKLQYIKSKSVDLQHYQSIVNQVTSRATTYLTNELFYQEFDAVIGIQLNEAQLLLRAG